MMNRLKRTQETYCVGDGFYELSPMKMIKIENRAINVDQIAHTEYKPATESAVRSRTTTEPLSSKGDASVSSPAQCVIGFAGGTELRLGGAEAEELTQAIDGRVG